MTFGHPALAIIAAAVLVVGWAAACYPFGRALVHPNLDFLIQASSSRWWPQAMDSAAGSLAISLIVLGAAAPLRTSLEPQSAAIAICLDTSGSMNALDVPPSRSRASASAIRNFIAAAPARTVIALIAFSGTARVLSVLTGDRPALYRALASAPAPNGQTAIGDALLLARAQLPQSGSRAIVVVTDGKNNHGSDPAIALHMLRVDHVAVEIVRVGRGADPARDLLRLRPAVTLLRVRRDLTVPVTCAGLALLAAAWLARERGAFGL